MDLTKVPLNEYGHVQTRNKLPVRLLCRDFVRHDNRSVIYATKYENGEESVYSCDESGRNGNDSMDLIPAPRKHTVSGWLCTNKHGTACFFSVKPAQSWMELNEIIAMREISVELTEGEGL